MRLLDSLIMRAADATAVPAGDALAVDRQLFSEYILSNLQALPEVTLLRDEVSSLTDQPTIITAGPLASQSLSESLHELTGTKLYFHDAIAPIIGCGYH